MDNTTYRTLLFVAMATILVTKASAMGHEQPYYSQRGGYHDDQHGGYMSDWSVDQWDQDGIQQQKCIDIPQNMSLCKSIGYSQMRLPNLLDHDTVREVTQQASSWVPLLGIRCHPDTKLFLCSLFSPVCLDRPIWPCRTLCQAVKNGCEALMLKYGFPWPEMLRCDKFPLDNDLCIGLQHDNKPGRP
jgi:secreted frizzled-related protein 5